MLTQPSAGEKSTLSTSSTSPTASTPSTPSRRSRWRRRLAEFVCALRAGSALLWYSGRLSLGLQAPLLVLVAGGVFAVAALTNKITDEESIFRILLVLESLFFVGFSMGLLPREKEARTLEVLLVCSRSRHGLLLVKFLPVCIFIAAISILLTIAFAWLYGGFPWLRMLGVPYLIAATLGILTVVLTLYLRNQYAAAALAVVFALIVAALWLDPFETFYRAPVRVMRHPPNLAMHRFLLVVAFAVLYDHAVRRLKHVELWMR